MPGMAARPGGTPGTTTRANTMPVITTHPGYTAGQIKPRVANTGGGSDR